MAQQEDKNNIIYDEYTIPSDFDKANSEVGGVGSGWKVKLTNFLQSPWWTVTIIILVAISSFALGRLSYLSSTREPVKVYYDNGIASSTPGSPDSAAAAITSVSTTASNAAASTVSGQVVASKNGTKYHLPNCPGAKQISAKNLITFDSAAAAQAAGYSPASNCPGLK